MDAARFAREAAQLVDGLPDQPWRWVPLEGRRFESSGGGYLSLEGVTVCVDDKGSAGPIHRDTAQQEGSAVVVETGMLLSDEEDAGVLATPNLPSSLGQWFVFDYHIVYSPSYSVPVLYFDARTADGQHVPMQQVWDLVPRHMSSAPDFDIYSTLTQQEHPFLQRPFYQVHPCKTATFMRIVRESGPEEPSSDEEENDEGSQPGGRHTGPAHTVPYLITWLSIVAPMARLSVPVPALPTQR